MKQFPSLAAILLAGCTTVGPDYRQPAVPTPGSYAETQTRDGMADTELAGWWRAFGDPQLDQLVGRALARNLDVQTAAARIREARAREIVAGASSRPQVGAQASATRQRISENAIPIPPGSGGGSNGAFGLPGSEFSTFRVGFDASWELDLFGRTRRGVEAARARTGTALWNRRDVQVSVAAEVADAYLALRTLQQRIAVAEAELARQQRSERLVAARVRGGLVTGQDLEQQRSERSTAAAAIPALRAQAEAQIHALGVITGDTPEALIAGLSPTTALPPAPPAIPAGLPSDLLRRRPDIRAAERELAASTADIGVAVADLYPRFSLTAAPALVSTALASLLEWGSRSFSIGVALDWPLLSGGRARGNIAVANARQEQALIAYRKSVLQALRDVEDALSRSDGDRQRLTELQDALGTATRAEDIARTRYRGGLVTYSDVLLAQARRLKLEDQVTETRGALGRDTVALFKALGGGWPDMAQAEAQP
jgi:NodT family efflux transporter outer membrane factor (OMF) lipoprotein